MGVFTLKYQCRAKTWGDFAEVSVPELNPSSEGSSPGLDLDQTHIEPSLPIGGEGERSGDMNRANGLVR